MPSARRATPRRPAFTLLELLVVMGIIVLLAAILVPIVSQVRTRAYVAATEAQMRRIMAACQMYYADFKAYPGPLSNSQLVGQPNAGNVRLTDENAGPIPFKNQITSSENLVLGLLGALSAPPSGSAPPVYSGFTPAPKHDVVNLNYNRPASYHYIDFIPEELSLPTGYAYSARFGTPTGAPIGGNPLMDALAQKDTSQAAGQPVGLDTPIPEFMDRIPDFMPILYLRASVGVSQSAGDPNPYSWIVSSATPPATPAQYDASQLRYYGFNHASVDPSTTNGDYPVPSNPTASGPDAQWVAYFINPAIAGQPRGKDTFILISAGADRLYGTKDDIIVTP